MDAEENDIVEGTVIVNGGRLAEGNDNLEGIVVVDDERLVGENEIVNDERLAGIVNDEGFVGENEIANDERLAEGKGIGNVRVHVCDACYPRVLLRDLEVSCASHLSIFSPPSSRLFSVSFLPSPSLAVQGLIRLLAQNYQKRPQTEEAEQRC
jgi:hypothetical protein